MRPRPWPCHSLPTAPSPDPAPDGITVAPGRTETLFSKATIGGLEVENSFVSGVGWVKPGESYPSRILLRNPGKAAVSGVTVTIPSAKGMSFSDARAAVGTESLTGGTVTWTVPSVAANSTAALILEAKAKTLAQEPTVVWRDISSRATVKVGSATTTLASHGPKVIPPSGGYESARYGDRPFPVVPVDYLDTKHEPTHPASQIEGVINDPKNASSTYNLYQEMSFGQLYPEGKIGSVTSAGAAPTAEDKLVFTTPDPQQTNTCTGTTAVDPTSGAPSPLYTKRVSDDGWYQLPGQRGYYGSDANGSAVVGSLGGVAALQAIDSGCGPTAKAAYDAAVVADPDIDYNNFDTDKDGVVDFFEVIYEGCGGNGASQLSVAAGCSPEDTGDNIWPHSSSLEFSYTDPTTGQNGYVSKDRLKDLEGNLLFYKDSSYTATTTTETKFPAFVRVGPYNVNPETALDFASVISHEYGHSLGLPDYYSTGNRDTYGDFNLMATDKGHNFDVIGKKEMGWIVPKVLAKGENKPVKDWKDSKVDTGSIDWVTPDGTPYTLSAAGGDYGTHNGEAYAAALPGRQLLDPEKIKQGASGKQVWYSQQGNGFGCPPTGGHNLDFAIPGLEDVAPGTPITMSFKSFFDIEWDYDYGFVLTGQPGEQGKVNYTSQPSENGYTNPVTENSQSNACQAQYGNGITGTPASYDNGTAAVDRVTGDYPDGPFVEDSYDISELAGVAGGVVRFSYATDPGLARLGWIIDDLTVKAGDKVLFESDFENGDGGTDDPRVYNGGCKEDLSTSGGVCTQGWSYLTAGTPSELEHSYVMEMRDRSGFDVDGRGESDRGPTTYEPGLLLTYTDEAHGYGNVGTDNPPAQSPLDSVPEPEVDTPNLNDATFVAKGARNTFSDAKAKPHLDNYSEPSRGENKANGGTQPWTFDYDCLGFTVDKLAGDTDNTAEKFDLTGDVSFTMGQGCAAFNYGTKADGPAPAPTPTPIAAAAGKVVTMAQPTRVLDSRGKAVGTTRGAKTGDVVLDLSGKVPDQAKAVLLNVTVTDPTAKGFVVVHPEGTATPETSNVNFVKGQTQANEVAVALPASRKVVLKVDSAKADLIADLIGYVVEGDVAGAGAVTALDKPVRALDTRESATKRRTGEVQVDLGSSVPADATSAVLNVTLQGADRRGFAVVYPTGSQKPGTSNVNTERGLTQANEVLTRIGTDRKVSVFVDSTTTSVIVDVVGYVSPKGSRFVALGAPQRAVDTRVGRGADKGQKAGEFQIARPVGVPAEATAVILNVTATRGSKSGFVTVYPGGSAQPATSNVNFPAGVNQANEVLTKLGTDGRVSLFVGGSGSPKTDVVVDVVGYLLPAA